MNVVNVTGGQQQQPTVCRLEFHGPALAQIEWLCKKAHKHKGAPFWLSVDEQGSVLGQVCLKDELQAWARLYSPLAGIDKGVPVFLELRLGDVKAALERCSKDRLTISVDHKGVIRANQTTVLEPLKGSRSLQQAATEAFVGVEEIPASPHELPGSHGSPIVAAPAVLSDYQQLHKYCSLFTTDPKEPARYAMRFLWVDHDRAVGVSTRRGAIYRRSSADTTRLPLSPSLPLPIPRDLFVAEKATKPARKDLFVHTNYGYAAATFDTRCDHGYSWELPDGDFGYEMEILEEVIRVAKSPHLGYSSASVSLPALTSALKTCKKKYETPMVAFYESSCCILEGEPWTAAAAKGLASEPTMVPFEIGHPLESPVFFHLADVVDLVAALSTEYVDFTFPQGCGAVPGRPLYVAEGKHFEHVLMPCPEPENHNLSDSPS